MIIGSAAHLKVCICGFQALLYAADGSCSPALCSKEEALVALDLGIRVGRITAEEIPEARRQIMTSDLPRYVSEVGIMGSICTFAEESKVEDEEDITDASYHRVH